MTWKNAIRKGGIAKREIKFNTKDRRVSVNADGFGNDDDLIDLGIGGSVSLDWELETVSYDEVRLEINKLGFTGDGELLYGDDSKDRIIPIEFEVDTDNIEIDMIIQAELTTRSLSFQVGVADIEIDIDFKGQEDLSKADITAKIEFE